MAADDLRALGHLELPCDVCGRFLDFDLWSGAEEYPFLSRLFAGGGFIDLAVQSWYLGAAGQGSNVWLHFLNHVGSLAGSGHDEVAVGEPLDGVPDRIP